MSNALADLSTIAPPEPRSTLGPRCSIHSIHDSLDNDEERETFRNWLSDATLRNQWIADRLRDLALQRNNQLLYAASHTIARHRRNGCRCWQRAPHLVVVDE